MSLVVDAGALIAFERQDRRILTLFARALERGVPITVPAGVVGQVWRDGRRQAVLARFLAAPQVTVLPLDDRLAREAGQLCGVRGTSDVIDAAVVIAAMRARAAIVTSDPEDIGRLNANARLIPC